jgi:hypothetical protein
VYTSAETTRWLRRRNLPVAEGDVREELPREVVIYLLVTLALRPHRVPPEAAAFLATEYLGHCGEVRLTH